MGVLTGAGEMLNTGPSPAFAMQNRGFESLIALIKIALLSTIIDG